MLKPACFFNLLEFRCRVCKRYCRNCGFKHVGRRKKLGKMTYGPHKGIWRDIVLMERRSNSVGIDLCLFWIDDRDLRSKRMFSFLLHCIQKSFCDDGGKEK